MAVQVESKRTLHLVHYRLALVKETSAVYTDTPPIVKTPQDLAEVVFTVAKAHEEPQEVFGIVAVNTKHRVIAVQEISRGHLSASIVHPREVFKNAILHNAAAIFVYHNHPSGDLTPSRDDIETTRRLVEVGELVGIGMLDHVIVNPSSRYLSFREQGLL